MGDTEELGGTFVVSVDELGLNGLWSTIKDLVEARIPLQGLTLPNKVAKPVSVPSLALMFVLSTDKRLLHLKQYSHSPVTWFRNPMTHLVLVSTADVHEYKSTTRAHLKRVTTDIEKDWGGGAVGSEWLILYVRPFELEAGDKGAKKVFEKLCDDFGSKRRERVVRLDVPLRAFDGPSSSSSSSRMMGGGGGRAHAAAGGAFVGPGASALAAGLDDLCGGLRDSIRAAFEARKMAYDAEVRRLHNERRDPKWSFTTLYLVKDSFALMLEGAGLWEDAFQEYVELETVYLDCLESAAQGGSSTATPATTQHSGGVGAHTDFGLTGHESEDVASLLSSSWRTMRGLVLRKRNVQEFQFRQYLFAAQARVLLRLNRPVDVAERGLVFVQNFLSLLAVKEAAGQVKPWFKECWSFSACMSLITTLTTFMQRCHDHLSSSTGDCQWGVTDHLLHHAAGGPPTNAAAQAALRQLAAMPPPDGAAATADKSRHHLPGTHSPTKASSQAAAPSASSSLPVLPASAWQLGAVDAAAAAAAADKAGGWEGGGGSSNSSSSNGTAEEDVPPLDLALLCGRAILPGNVSLLLQEGEPRRELLDKLYCCLLGHLYHLARGELLRLGSALQLPEAAAANASILQLGKAAFSPSPAKSNTAGTGSSGGGSPARSPSKAAAAGGSSGSPVKQAKAAAAAAGAVFGQAQQQQQNQQLSKRSSSLTAGVEMLLQASASGALSPRMVAQLQELLMTPLCGFSMMINKYADGHSNGLAYEVHTPRLEQDPLSAALHRADSQSTPYNTNHAAAGVASSPSMAAAAPSPFSRSSTAAAAGGNPSAAAPAAGSGGMLDRLRRVGSNSGGSITSSNSGGGIPAAAAAGSTGAQHSRLSKVTGELTQQEQEEEEASTAVPLDAQDSAGGGNNNNDITAGMRRQDSSTSLATVNFGGQNSADGGAASFSGPSVGPGSGGCQPGVITDDVTDDISLSGASVTSGVTARAAAGSDAASLADSASSLAPRPAHGRTQSAIESGSTAAAAAAHHHHQSSSLLPPAAAAAVGSAPLLSAPPPAGDPLAAAGVSLPKVATHNRSASALPAAAGTTTAAGETAAAAAGSGSPKQQEDLARPTSSPEQGLRSRRAAAPAALPPTAATLAAAAAVPGWVGEWRLQLALRSPACFQELVLALSRRAAWCYAKAGRVRSSALIYADVAVLALQRGQLETAASLLDRMHHIFACEGWQQLLGVLLPKLLACQALAAQPLLPFTALKLLALKPGAALPDDRQAAFDELLAAVGATPPALQAATVTAAAAADAAAAAGVSSGTVQLATLSAIQMRPAPGTYSHFFGNEALQAEQPSSSSSSSSPAEQGVDGHNSSRYHQQQQLVPVLSPPAQPYGRCSSSSSSKNASTQQQQQGGAALLVVGDSLPLAVDVISSLPSPLLLQRPVLSLVQLHKNMGGPPGVLQPGSRGFSDAAAAARGKPGFSAIWDAISSSGGGGAGGVLGSHDALSRDHTTRWQEGDELLVSKLLAAYSPTDADSSDSNNSSATAAAAGGGGGSSGCQLLPDGSLLLAPGLNRLVFRVAPVQAGLYCLKQLRAALGVCGELIIGLPPPGSLSLLAAATNLSSSCQNSSSSRASSGAAGGAAAAARGGAAAVSPGNTAASTGLPAAAGGAGGADVVLTGGVTSAGAVVSEVVVARVVDPTPRLRLDPVIPEGSLPVGTTAWLGLLVTPLQNHTLQNPRLHLQPNKHITLAGAVLSGTAGNAQQQQQQQQQQLGLPPTAGRSSIDQQQQHPGLLFGGLSAAQLSAASTSSGSNVSLGGHMQQQQKQLGHFVYVMPVQQQQQQHSAVAEPGTEVGSSQQQQQQHQHQEQQSPGRWLPLRRGCVDLSELLPPDGVMSGPLLVWMQVAVASPPKPQATIPIAALPHPAAAAGAHKPQQQQQQQLSLCQGPKVLPEPCVLVASRAQDAVGDMLLQLEYTADAGVWRSHACSLQLPLQQPVSISATALQLPSGAVAISMTLSLDPHLTCSTFILHQAALRPQFGLLLGPGLAAAGGDISNSRVSQGGAAVDEGLGGSRVGFSEAVPLVLVPGGTAGLSFLLLPDPGDKLTGSFEADGCNMLLLTYSLVPNTPAAPIMDPSGSGQQLPQPPCIPEGKLDAAAAPASSNALPAPTTSSGAPAASISPAAAAGGGGSSSGSSSAVVATLQLPFWLEFPSGDRASPAAATVMVTLLGPFSGRMGHPVTLSWQLARIASADAAAGDAGGSVAGAAAEQAGFSSIPLGGLDSQQGKDGVSNTTNSSSSRQLPADSDELLCYELVFGQEQKQQDHQGLGGAGAGAGNDTPGPSRLGAGGSRMNSPAAAAAAADLGGGISSAANAALIWGVSGAAPSGVVRLGRAPGSLAVVEVVLVPHATGQVVAPQLVMKSPGGNQLVLAEGTAAAGGSHTLRTLTISR